MSDPAFTQSDLFSITAMEQVELAAAVRGLLSANSYWSAGNNPLSPPTRDVARTLAEAGFTLHHCHRYDLLPVLAWRMCMLPIPAESGSGIAASWTTHDLLPDWDWRITCSDTCQLMSALPRSLLHMFRVPDRRRGTAGTCLATRRGQRTEAGL
jgi:hypothetical protein